MVDNLSDALYMAGAILIFVIALTVSMSSFTEMRTQIDEIIEADSKLELVTDEQGYINYMSGKDELNEDLDVRVVGPETVVSSMYRVAKENYIVYIKMDNIPSEIDTITLSQKGLDAQKYKGTDIIEKNDEIIEITINGQNSNIDVLLEDKGLYKALIKDNGKKFKEYLGVYQESSGADEANKTTYRVVTYVEI